jgi:6-phosphogluconolactonase
MKSYTNRVDLEEELSHTLALLITDSIAEFGNCRILFSGGTSPWGIYRRLSELDVEWEKVIVGLVDERFVSVSDPQSNEASLRSSLLDHLPSGCDFRSMVCDITDYETNLEYARKGYQPFMERTDIAVLGMGEDGHTASLFPTDPVSLEILRYNEVNIFNTTAPNEPSRRISCSSQLLKNCRNSFLVLFGENKKKALNLSFEKRLPVAALLDESNNVTIYFCAS